MHVIYSLARILGKLWNTVSFRPTALESEWSVVQFRCSKFSQRTASLDLSSQTATISESFWLIFTQSISSELLTDYHPNISDWSPRFRHWTFLSRHFSLHNFCWDLGTARLRHNSRWRRLGNSKGQKHKINSLTLALWTKSQLLNPQTIIWKC